MRKTFLYWMSQTFFFQFSFNFSILGFIACMWIHKLPFSEKFWSICMGFCACPDHGIKNFFKDNVSSRFPNWKIPPNVSYWAFLNFKKLTFFKFINWLKKLKIISKVSKCLSQNGCCNLSIWKPFQNIVLEKYLSPWWRKSWHAQKSMPIDRDFFFFKRREVDGWRA
jgi:hypothetical protein